MGHPSQDTKVVSTDHGNGRVTVRYFCPGCDHCHSVDAKRWNWNGDENNPSLHPSVRHFIKHANETETTTCHYFVKNGQIKYCNDCKHELSNQIIDMPLIR